MHLVLVLGEERAGAHLVDRGVELHDRLVICRPIRARSDGESTPLVVGAYAVRDRGEALLSLRQVVEVLGAHAPRDVHHVHGKKGTGESQDCVGRAHVL